MKVALLMGGRSAEREISLRTGRGIAQSLRQLGHDVLAVDAADGRILPAGEEERAALPPEARPGTGVALSATGLAGADSINQAEVVFIALHGGSGEDGTIQALLDLAGKPYTGSGVLASALAMNKAMAKRLFEHEGIPTPRWALAHGPEEAPALDLEALGGFPLVVKPNEQGSTVGLTIVRKPEALAAAIELALEYGPDALIEEYIDGRELTVSALGDEVLPIVEIRPRSGHYDYEAKYTAGMSEYFCPADLPEALAARIGDLGLRAARVLGCTGVARADFRLSSAGAPYCLEVNTIPGMTPTSLVPMAARARGLSYDQLVNRMLELAVEDWERRHKPSRRNLRTSA
jgi:D-alanine-D-alanine ligase